MGQFRVTLNSVTYTAESDEIRTEEDARLSFYKFIQAKLDAQNLDIHIECLERVTDELE